MESVKISVIVPVYNGETTLDRCISSVLSQSHVNFELILVDDGSTDRSLDICHSYTDPRITVIRKENGGVSSARNTGIVSATGDYVFFLDSDDALDSTCLEKISVLAEGGYDLIAISLHVICSDGQDRVIGLKQDLVSENVFDTLLDDPEPFGVCGGKAVKTSFIKDRGLLFDTSMYSQEDMRFFLQVYRYGESFYFSPYDGYKYYYSVSGRKPPVKDHVENQVLTIRYATERNADVYCIAHASMRLCDSLYGYLAYAPDDGRVSELLSTFRSIDGITEALSYSKASGLSEKLRRRFIKGNDGAILRLMKNRRLLKKLLRRG